MVIDRPYGSPLVASAGVDKQGQVNRCPCDHHAFVIKSPVMDLDQSPWTVLALPVPFPGNGALPTSVRTYFPVDVPRPREGTR
jgi:hypothetical protein